MSGWGSTACGATRPPMTVSAAARRGARDPARAPGTEIAVAFVRTPFAMAQTAWDLQRVSGGRLLLGLGTECGLTSSAGSPPSSRPGGAHRRLHPLLRAIWGYLPDVARPASKAASTAPRYQRLLQPWPDRAPDIPISLAGVASPWRAPPARWPMAFTSSRCTAGVSARRRVARGRREGPRLRPRPDGGGPDHLGLHRHPRDRERADGGRERRAPADRLRCPRPTYRPFRRITASRRSTRSSARSPGRPLRRDADAGSRRPAHAVAVSAEPASVGDAIARATPAIRSSASTLRDDPGRRPRRTPRGAGRPNQIRLTHRTWRRGSRRRCQTQARPRAASIPYATASDSVSRFAALGSHRLSPQASSMAREKGSP